MDDLHTPFVQEDWHFATDGRILVRADESAAGVIGPSEKRPNCVQICEWLDPARKWPMNWCPVCEGRGSVVDAVQCELCDGGGTVAKYHNDDPDDFLESPCQVCKGIGRTFKTPCDFCKGVGESDTMPTLQEIGHNRVQASYDKRIRKLGEVEYLTINVGDKSATGGDCIAFRGHRFVGLLMPLRREA